MNWLARLSLLTCILLLNVGFMDGQIVPKNQPAKSVRDVLRAHARFTAAPTGDTADVHWDSRFASASGFNGPVLAIYIDGTDVYFGGSFTAVGGAAINGIVKWDGLSWSPLGAGVNGEVFAITKFHNDLYVGGVINAAGGAPATNLAKWDGQNWSALGVYPGDGVSDAVYDMVTLRDSLYIAGAFKWYDTLKVDGMAVWDGTSVSAMQGTKSYSSDLFCLATDGTNIYVGGGFFEFWDGVKYINGEGVVRWDGNAWGILGNVPLHAGTQGEVHGMTYWNGSLYVGGSFDSAGVVVAHNVARWNGTDWSAVGPGLNGPVQVMMRTGSNIYVGGGFTASGIDSMYTLAMYDTSTGSWSKVANGVAPSSSTVLALAISGSTLYLGGYLSTWNNSYQTGQATDYYAAAVNGGAITYLGTTPVADGLSGSGSLTTVNDWTDQQVNALAIDGDLVYVGGDFAVAGGLRANNIACWNNSTKTWSTLGEGLDGEVISLAMIGSDLYAAGTFHTAGGSPANHVARWDGASWHPLGSPPNDGIQGEAEGLLAFSGSLYVTGYITSAGGTPVSYIAVWNGSTWSGLGSGLDWISVALAAYHNELYVGGWFTHAGGFSANYIAKWDGVSWKNVGAYPDTGMNGPVFTLNVAGDELVAGGQFTMAGPVPANNIVRWNGSSWSPLGAGFNAVVRAIESSGSSVYAGGDFTKTGILTVNQIARWDTSSLIWSPLGSGTNDRVFSLKFLGNDLFVGGRFLVAGDKASSILGLWNTSSTLSVGESGARVPATFSLSQNFPNPFNPSTAISYQLSAVSHVRLVVYDILGREVATLVNGRQDAGQHSVRWNASQCASGLYFCRLTAGQFVQTRKMLLMK